MKNDKNYKKAIAIFIVLLVLLVPNIKTLLLNNYSYIKVMEAIKAIQDDDQGDLKNYLCENVQMKNSVVLCYNKVVTPRPNDV